MIEFIFGIFTLLGGLFVTLLVLFIGVGLLKIFFGSIAFMGGFVLKAVGSFIFWCIAIFVILCLIF